MTNAGNRYYHVGIADCGCTTDEVAADACSCVYVPEPEPTDAELMEELCRPDRTRVGYGGRIYPIVSGWKRDAQLKFVHMEGPAREFYARKRTDWERETNRLHAIDMARRAARMQWRFLHRRCRRLLSN